MSNPIPPPPFGPAPGQGPTSSAPPPPPAYLQPNPSPGAAAPAPQFQPAPQSPGVPPPPNYGSPPPNYGAPGAPGAFGAQQPYGPQGYQQFGVAPATAKRSISVWNILVGLSGVAVGISIFLHWVSIEITSDSFTANANDIPLQFLWDANTDAETGFPLRWPLVIAGLLMITSAFNLRAKGAALIGSILALVVGLAYVRSANSLFSDGTGLGLTDFVGIGAWICIVAAVVGTIGSIGLMTRST